MLGFQNKKWIYPIEQAAEQAGDREPKTSQSAIAPAVKNSLDVEVDPVPGAISSAAKNSPGVEAEPVSEAIESKIEPAAFGKLTFSELPKESRLALANEILRDKQDKKMITVRQLIELLQQRCNPDAVIRIAIPGNDYSENISFVEQCDDKEIHFCDSKPDERPTLEDYLANASDYWIEVVEEVDNFARIKVHRTIPIAPPNAT